ncbi:hypothetical protein F8388_026861 [Cannabis sativa]|uniref:PA domain-containing protein n=1 Tax=Cannabis sativa TaxID=3483 RepID=A0A7J6H1N0_CANSA|nr:hypothetical protein F8388_026861 [Cannabis sativa]
MGDSTSLFLLTKDIVCSFYEYLLKVWIQGNKTPAASQHGVLVSCSAGNSGLNPSTATNIAPWILADVILGDGRILIGVSLYAGEPLAADAKLSLIYAGDAGNRYCYSGSLIASKVAEKIVVCDRGGNARVKKGSAVKLAGGLALVLANTEDSGEELIADSHLIPATMVGQINGDKIKQYIKSSDDPAATILFRGTVIGSSLAAPKGKNQDF